MKKRVSIKVQLLIAFFIVCLSFLFILGYSIFKLDDSINVYDEIFTHMYPNIMEIRTGHLLYIQCIADMRGMVLYDSLNDNNYEKRYQEDILKVKESVANFKSKSKDDNVKK